MDFLFFFRLLNIIQEVNYPNTTLSVEKPHAPSSTNANKTRTPLFPWLNKWSNGQIPEEPGEDCRGIYGCFPTGFPWESSERPVSLPPLLLQEIKPFFCFYSARQASCQKISVEDNAAIRMLDISPTSHLIVITHGFLHSVEMPWVTDMVAALLNKYDINLRVMTFDWRKGSRPPYAQTTANVRLMGAVAGHVLNTIMETHGLKPSNLHLIGHSLGAHLFGYAGNFLKGHGKGIEVGRITGMDPAGPYFRRTPPEVHLDASDAFLVDIIHTDSTDIIPSVPVSLGLPDASGNLDFFPNGGGEQNGCGENPQENHMEGGHVKGLLEYIGCSHERAHRYLTSSIAGNCTYIGVECSSWQDFKNGKCWDCNKNRCFKMGFDIRRIFPDEDHKFGTKRQVENLNEIVFNGETKISIYLATTTNEYLCGNQFRFTLRTSNSEEASQSGGDFGKFSLVLRGETQNIRIAPFQEIRHIKPGINITWVEAIPEIGEILSLVFVYEGDESFLSRLLRSMYSPPSVYLQEIVIEKLLPDERITLKFCEELVTSGEAVILKPENDCKKSLEASSFSAEDFDS